jgi:hypothetical protein
MCRLTGMAVVCTIAFLTDGRANDPEEAASGYRTEVYFRDRADEVRRKLIRNGKLSLEGLQLQAEVRKDGSLRGVTFHLSAVFRGQVESVGDLILLAKVKPDINPVEGRALMLTLRNDLTRPGFPAVVLDLHGVVLSTGDGRPIVLRHWSLFIPDSRFRDDR